MKTFVKTIATFFGKKEERKIPLLSLGVFVCISVLTAFSPYLLARISAGGAWRGVYPEITHEYLYYLPQAKAVAEGKISSNPFFLEYDKNGWSPHAGLAIALSGLPFMAGMSPDYANMFNTFAWSMVFFVALFFFCRRWGLSVFIATLVCIISFFGVNPEYMLRPAVMQIVFPIFLLFLSALYAWVARPDTARGIILGAFLALTLYLYSFEAQVAVASFAVAFVILLWRSGFSKKIFGSMAVVSGTALILGAPFLFFFWGVAHHPFYRDVLFRYGILQWRVIDPRAYEALALVLLALFSFVLARKHSAEAKEENIGDISGWLVLFSSAFGMLLVGMSNVFTDMDVEHFHHAERFLILIVSILSLPLILLLARFIQTTKIQWKQILAGIAIFALVANFSNRLLSVPELFRQIVLDSPKVQKVGSILQWLDTIPEKKVVLDHTELSSYIPTYTKHKVVYALPAKYFLVSQKEIDERYLLAHIGNPMTAEAIAQSASAKFEGPQYQYIAQRTHWYAIRCRLLLLGDWCPKMIGEKDLLPLAHYGEMEEQGVAMKNNPSPFFEKYHVGIVVFAKGDTINAVFKDAKPAYEDSGYVAYYTSLPQ